MIINFWQVAQKNLFILY